MVILISYGFALGQNKFNALKIRVVVATEPDGKITNPSDLFPTDKVLADEANLETTTELLVIKQNRISTGKLL